MAEAKRKTTPKTKQPEQGELLLGGVGRILQKERRARKITIKQISNHLNIREDYLDALEKERYDDLPAMAYVKGFARSYGAFLDLDTNDLVKRLEHAQTQAEVLAMPEPIESNGHASRFLMFMSIAIALAVFVVWHIVSDSEIETPVGNTPILEEKKSVNETIEPVTKMMEESAKAAENSVEGVETEAVEPSPSDESYETNSTENVSGVIPAVVEETVAIEEVPVVQNVRLVAKDKVWIQVRTPSNKRTIFNKVMSKGQEFTVTTDKKAVVDIGKPEALEFYINEQHLGHISSTNVIRGLALDAAFLTSGQRQFVLEPAAGLNH